MLAVLLAFVSPTQSQEVPRLHQGRTYAEERKQLLAFNWQKVIDFTKSCEKTDGGGLRNGFSRVTCFRYQEHLDCSATGYCAFRWRNQIGTTLKVITLGDRYIVMSWTTE